MTPVDAELVLATRNDHKLREFRRLLPDTPLCPLPDGVPSPEETGQTFADNALIKAHAAVAVTGRASIADDSGIEAEALGGAPGVRSARYAGEPVSDARNNAALVAALRGIADRRAHYYCVLVLVRHADDPQPILAEGIWHGTIVDTPRGSGGFGYDPHFQDAITGRTGAELPLQRKNALSHRGKAMRRLIARLEMLQRDGG